MITIGQKICPVKAMHDIKILINKEQSFIKLIFNLSYVIRCLTLTSEIRFEVPVQKYGVFSIGIDRG